MKKNLNIALLILLGVLLSTQSFAMGHKNKAKTKTKKSQVSEYTAPDFTLKNVIDGSVVDLRNYRGKVVLLNFWATWCPPCRQEIPDLIKLHENYKKDFVVIGLSVDRGSADAVKEFVEKMKMTYPVAMAGQEITFDYGGITGIPTTFIINRQGELVQKIVGFRNYNQFESYIKPFLKEK